MRFYVVTDGTGETLGCQRSLRQAQALGRSYGISFTVDAVDVSINAETVRRLLGALGGYAIEQREVWREEAGT